MASTIQKICWYLTDSSFRFSMNNKWGLYKSLSDRDFIEKRYKAYFGKEIDIDNPVSFNQKLQWLKLYDRKPLYTQLVDKFESKLYVEKIIGKEHIIPTLGVWDNYNDIDFDKLPNQFVLKCTHDSGGLVICRDKANLDLQIAKKKIEASLKKNYYLEGREWPYKDVKPRIIAEEYMEDDNNVESKGLIDYKFFCFHGIPKFIYVSKGLENHATASISFYDLNGQEMNFHRNDYKQLHNFQFPDNFLEMTRIANVLADNVNCAFVRIDLYSIKGNVYFSEITFSPCSGMIPFEPVEADDELGKLLNIP